MMNNSYLIPVSIFIPFIIGMLLIFWRSIPKETKSILAGIGFLIPALIACYLVCIFDAAVERFHGYAFYSNMGPIAMIANLQLGLNGISLYLYLLAGVVGLAAGIYAMQSELEGKGTYLGLLLVMSSGLLGMFASIDIFFFYFFHELALIPTFIMIGIWGGRMKGSIALELTIYLTLGAMLSLIGLIALYVSSDAHSFDIITIREYLAKESISSVFQKNIFALLMFGFGILVSLWPFHTWAPKGYAAAPAPVAMLHAGVLKKFGLYGLIQIALPSIPTGAAHWASFLSWLAIGNVLIIGFVTVAQKDLKQMIGFSSVMHMGYCFLGIATLSILGVGGTVLLMVAHGLSVALLFLLSTEIHTRVETLEMRHMGGLCEKAPVLCAFFLIAILATIGLPGFANFWGELTIFLSLWQMNPWYVAAAVLGVVISAIYGLRAMAAIFFGPPSESLREHVWEKKLIEDLSWKQRIAPVLLIVFLLIIGFWPKNMVQTINGVLSGVNSPIIAKK